MSPRPTSKARRPRSRLRPRAGSVLRSFAAWALPGCLPQSGGHAASAQGAAHGPGWLHHVVDELPVLLALVAAVGLFHHFGVAHGLIPQTMRLAHFFESNALFAPRWAANAFDREHAPSAAAPEPTVTVLRVDADFFERDFGGVTPVSRAQLAPLIDRLTDRLRDKPSPGKPDRPVVAIDIDVTARGDAALPATIADCAGAPASATASTASPGDGALLAALGKLSRQATVISIVMPRTTCEARRQRDDSVRALCAAGVHFATAKTYVDAGEPFYRFLHHRKGGEHDPQAPVAAAAWPAVYPALGTLAGLALVHPGCTPENGARPALKDRSGQEREAAACGALAAICQAASTGGPLPVIDFDDRDAEPLVDAYEWSYFDLLSGNTHVRPDDLGKAGDIDTAVDAVLLKWSKDRGTMPAPIFLLSIDDGYTDRHFTVADQVEPTLGDAIHATMALSHIDPLCPAHPLVNAAIDVLLGTAYLLLWVGSQQAIERLEQKRLPWTGQFWLAWTPLVLFALLGWVSLYVSASQLGDRRWLDPLPVLAGLTLHAYLAVYGRAVGSSVVRHGGARPIDRHLACVVRSALRWLPVAWWLAVVAFHPESCPSDFPALPGG